ncbi:hypothetical protein JL720_10433 [Aureococcus anophagefferens]|nr:hypothetical protein JL720_10433 [Aureococcus anophagefferens]
MVDAFELWFLLLPAVARAGQYGFIQDGSTCGTVVTYTSGWYNVCDDGWDIVDAHLVDGPDAYSGTIYVLNPHTNTWGNACDAGTSPTDVVCRQVFGTDYQAYMATANNYFGSAANDGNFVYDDVGCYGYENYLAGARTRTRTTAATASRRASSASRRRPT